MTEVAWVTTAYPWEGEPVGGTFHRTLARSLVQAGVGVTVVTPTPIAPWPLPRLRPQWRLYADAPRRATDDGVFVIRPRYPNVPGQPTWSRPDEMMAGAVWRVRNDWKRAEIVHGHYAIGGLAAWRVARRAGLPLAVTFHGSDLNLWPDDFPERLADLRSCVLEAALVVTVSGALADRLRTLTGVHATVLPIGIDHGALRARTLPREEARRRLGLDPDAIAVLFIGNLLPAKGIRPLVDAVASLDRRVRLDLVGDGPEAGYGSTDGRLTGRLAYRGQQPPTEIPVWLSAADVLVLPSLREGLPTVLVEAGSVGLPVIASAVGGVPVLLANDRGRLIETAPGETPSADAIAAAIQAAIDDPAATRASAARLRTHVEAEHDVRTNAARLAAAYAAVLAPTGAGR